jgi:hypothetical protein
VLCTSCTALPTSTVPWRTLCRFPADRTMSCMFLWSCVLILTFMCACRMVYGNISRSASAYGSESRRDSGGRTGDGDGPRSAGTFSCETGTGTVAEPAQPQPEPRPGPTLALATSLPLGESFPLPSPPTVNVAVGTEFEVQALTVLSAVYSTYAPYSPALYIGHQYCASDLLCRDCTCCHYKPPCVLLPSYYHRHYYYYSYTEL